MNTPSIISIIVGLMLMSALAAAGRSLSAKRARAGRLKDLEQQRGPTARWLDLFRQTWPKTTPGLPPIKALRVLSHSLYFPFFRSATVGDINGDTIGVQIASVEQARSRYPADLNDESIRALRVAFPDVDDGALQSVTAALEKAHLVFHHLCDLDRDALECARIALGSSDTGLTKTKKEEFLQLSRHADGDVRAEYSICAAEARQCLLRLGVPQEMIPAIASVREAIAATAGAKADQWRGKLDEETLAGFSEEQFVQWAMAIALHDSPRWSAYPVLKGEILEGGGSAAFSLSNYVFVAEIDDPSGEYLVAFREVQSLRKVRVRGRAFCEVAMRNGQRLLIPWRSISCFPDLERSVETPPKPADELVAEMLSSADADLLAEATAIEAQV